MAEHVGGELPVVFRWLARPAGLLPLGPALTLAIRRFARRRPGVFERLGPHARASFLIEPTDLDIAFLLVPDGGNARVTAFPRRCPTGADVHVRGPLLTLLGLLDGTFDGDALFFNRAIAVSGRTDALLALRNAIEDAELKPSDLAGVTGDLGRMIDRGVFAGLALVRRTAGAPESGESA